MKKFFVISALLLVASLFTVSAEERGYKYEYQESNLTYKNVIVYKVLDHRDAYVVMYAKGHREVGNVTIPKKWYKESQHKLAFRTLPAGMSPYMTVLYKSGEFSQVILTMPVNRGDSTWGIADSNVQVDANKDTFDIVY